MGAASSRGPASASAVAARGGVEQKERTSRRRQSMRSKELETLAMTESQSESVAGRPVQEHEEEVVEARLAKTSLRGPSIRTWTSSVR